MWISLGVVAVLIPATLLGLNMGTAVIFHEGSTLLVVANALRLLAYQTSTPAHPHTRTGAFCRPCDDVISVNDSLLRKPTGA